MQFVLESYLSIGVQFQELGRLVGFPHLEGWNVELHAHILGRNLCLPGILVAREGV